MKHKDLCIENKKIEIFDDIFSASERFKLYEFVNTSLYTVDRFGNNAPEHTKFHKTLKSSYNLTDILNFGFFNNQHILNYIKKNNLRVRECYVNLCTASDVYTYHTDTYTADIPTGLYYANLEWHPTWEGETHFSNENMDEILYSSSFIPGRFIAFDGNIPHKSSQPGPLAEFYRFVFTIKFSKKEDLEKNYFNSVKIEDFIYKKDIELDDKEKENLEYLKTKCNGIMHTRTCTLYEHLSNTFYILKHLNQDNDTCFAGMLHSIYGTEYFNPGMFTAESEVIEKIGESANQLIKYFSIQNRDFNIVENSLNLDKKNHLALLYILYANYIEQSYRQAIDRNLICRIRSAIDSLTVSR
jgi:hypothetical protein